MLKTTNGGASWTVQNTTLTTGRLNAIHFLDKNTGIAAGWWGGMARTANGGTNWFPVFIDSGFTENIIALDFATPEAGRFFTELGHTYVSADSGKTWSPL
jgi:photosystem II stability/assembly factor-like uncharacterized protein